MICNIWIESKKFAGVIVTNSHNYIHCWGSGGEGSLMLSLSEQS